MSWVVKVPASAANIGAGYETLALTLGLYNTYKVSHATDGFSISAYGIDADIIPKDNSNLIVQAFDLVVKEYNYSYKDFSFEMESHIPVAKGMGSSAAAIIAGVSLAYQVLDLPFLVEEILRIAVSLEKQAANLVPALLGGLQLVYCKEDELKFKKLCPHPDLAVVLVVPEREVVKKSNKKSLPKNISLDDCIFNMHRLASTVQSLQEGDLDELTYSLKGRLHQMHLMEQMDGLEDIYMELEKEYPGWIIIGSGPTLLHFVALVNQSKVSSHVEQLMNTLALPVTVMHCIPVSDGVLYMETKEDDE